MDYFPVSFHFRVTFTDLGSNSNDIKFQSVSGLNQEVQTESIKEGGENRFEHVVPTRIKTPNLVLKRGILTSDNSEITQWCKNAFEDQSFLPTDLLVELLNENHEPLLTWKVIYAIPVKWSLNEFNAEKSEILIETFELNYNRLVYQN